MGRSLFGATNFFRATSGGHVARTLCDVVRNRYFAQFAQGSRCAGNFFRAQPSKVAGDGVLAHAQPPAKLFRAQRGVSPDKRPQRFASSVDLSTGLLSFGLGRLLGALADGLFQVSPGRLSRSFAASSLMCGWAVSRALIASMASRSSWESGRARSKAASAASKFRSATNDRRAWIFLIVSINP